VDIVTDIDNFITSDSTEQDIIEFVENVSTENYNEVLEYHSELQVIKAVSLILKLTRRPWKKWQLVVFRE
jgi:hypothetical protein